MKAKQELLTKMQELKACKDAVVWVTTLETDLASEVWDQCQRGDWLLWLAGELGADRKLLVSAACASARTSLTHIKDPQALEIATKALVIAEKWTKGAATDEELKIAATSAAAASAASADYDAAYAAASYNAASYNAASYNAVYAAYAYAAAYAAASYNAVYAAYDTACAYAYDAVYNAASAASAASATAATAARTESLASSAKIVKDIIKWEDLNF